MTHGRCEPTLSPIRACCLQELFGAAVAVVRIIDLSLARTHRAGSAGLRSAGGPVLSCWSLFRTFLFALEVQIGDSKLRHFLQLLPVNLSHPSHASDTRTSPCPPSHGTTGRVTAGPVTVRWRRPTPRAIRDESNPHDESSPSL